jgi:SDR family mycofactocin-dependent oxidoreductase
MGRMDGKVALITGAARGQGRQHAITLAKEGADILALDLCGPTGNLEYPLATPDDLQQTVSEIEALDRRVIAVQGDVRRQQDLDDLVARGIDEFGTINVVIANAGIYTVNDFWKMTEEEWREVVDVCLDGVWRTCKAVAPHLIETQQGSIILVASVNALEGAAKISSYIAAKHGVAGLAKAFALELGPHNIRVNTINPGPVDTGIINNQMSYDNSSGMGKGEGTRAHLQQAIKAFPVLKDRGLLQPQATSNAVLFLASDESSEITGLELVVDAGHMLLPGLNPEAFAHNLQHPIT